jgi:hypothetical protein
MIGEESADVALDDTFAVLTLSGGDNLPWAGFVEQVASLLGLTPVVLAVEPSATLQTGPEEVLARAGELTIPLLLLPLAPVVLDGERQSTPGIRRVLLPCEGAPEDTKRLRRLVHRFDRAGVETVMLHAITDDTRPQFWEGAGHHVAAWREEFLRRQGTEKVTFHISTEGPVDAVRAYVGDTDLVALFWRGIATVGRAAVIRAVIGSALPIPVLLIPTAWADARLAAHPAESEEPVRAQKRSGAL